MIDHTAAAGLWDRYKRGERNVFTHMLCTMQGNARSRIFVGGIAPIASLRRRSTATSPSSSGSWTKSHAMAAGRWSRAPISPRRLVRSTPCWRTQLAGSAGKRLFHLIGNKLIKSTTPKHPGVRLVLMIAIPNRAGLVLAFGPRSGAGFDARIGKGHFASPVRTS